MALRANRIEPRRPSPRLYVMAPQVADPAGVADTLTAVLAAAEVAAVLLRLTATDERTLINHVKALAPLVQSQGAALLLDGHLEIVARAGADGTHASGLSACEEALPVLKPAR